MLLSKKGGPTSGIYGSADYVGVHGLLRDLVATELGVGELVGSPCAPGDRRADLLRHVTEGEGMSHSALRSSLRDFVDDTLDH